MSGPTSLILTLCAWLLPCAALAAPYTILNEVKILSHDPESGRNFGRAMDLDGDTLAVGAGPFIGVDERRVEIRRRYHGGVDAWQTVARIITPNGNSSDFFGHHVGISGDWLAVGAVSAPGGGAVYLYHRDQGGADNWGLARTITSPFAPTNSSFGRVAIDGDVLVVGEPSGPTGGEAHVFHRNQGGADNWGHVTALGHPGGSTANFGFAVDVHCDHIVVGAPTALVSGESRGIAVVFRRNSGGADNWGSVKTLRASDEAEFHRFGNAVAIYGETIAVGKDRPVGDAGQAYVFRRNEGGADQWDQVDILTPSVSAANDHFGESVAVFNDAILVGATEIAGIGGGHAYLFQRNEGGADQWDEVMQLTTSDEAAGDFFGTSVAINGSHLVAGAPGDDDLFGANGAVYIYPNVCDHFSPERILTAVAPTPGSWYGRAADIWGDTLVVGESLFGTATHGRVHVHYRNTGGADAWDFETFAAPESSLGTSTTHLGQAVAIWDDTIVAGSFMDYSNAILVGAAFVFDRNEGGQDNWGEVAALSPSVISSFKSFGLSVDVHCDTIVVGALGEDVDSFINAGTAYVFERNQGGAGNWGQVIRLNANDLTTNAAFGSAVSVFGDMIAVGAPRANSVTGASKTGAVYLFGRNQGGANQWGQMAKLSASDAALLDGFGNAVALYQNLLAVGAPGVDTQQGDGDAAYLFERVGDAWLQAARMTPDNFFPGIFFGRSVSVWDDLFVVSSKESYSAGYVYQRNAGGYNRWGLTSRLHTTNILSTGVGANVSLFGRNILAGIRSMSVPGFADAGGAILFEPSCRIVDTTNDVVNGAAAPTSLREAISAANAKDGSDCIILPAGRYTIDLVASDEDANATGDFDILTEGKLTIKGVGAKQTMIDGNSLDRVFHVHTNAEACFQDLSIQHGLTPAVGGNGQDGGGILNYGVTTLRRVMVVSNATAAGNSGSGDGGNGGGIYCSPGSLFVYDSTIAFNQTGNGDDISGAGSAGDGGDGGGIAYEQAVNLVLDNSTISGNQTGRGGINVGSGAGGSGGAGGGMYLSFSATGRVTHCTIVENSCAVGGTGSPGGPDGSGGGFFTLFTDTFLGHTILSDNTVPAGGGGPAANGAIISEGYNLFDDEDNILFSGTTEGHVTNNAQLNAFADNGGPTCTHVPQGGSPAIDAGDPAFALHNDRDQRGVSRALNAVIDIGSVETTVDFDNDGIPDFWENTMGLDAANPGDGPVDQDFDGFNADEEYIADTDPFNENIFHRISDISANSPVTVEVPSSSLRLYRLWFTTNLPAQTWSEATFSTGNGGFLDLVDPAGDPTRAYNVTVELP